jgi:hypothetical protein
LISELKRSDRRKTISGVARQLMHPDHGDDNDRNAESEQGWMPS